VMLVGEQPGDKEDLAANPLLSGRTSARPRADRRRYRPAENLRHHAVKHFKFVQRARLPAPEAEHAGDPGLPAMV